MWSSYLEGIEPLIPQEKKPPSYPKSRFTRLYAEIKNLQPVTFAQEGFLGSAIDHMVAYMVSQTQNCNDLRMEIVASVSEHNEKVSEFVEFEEEMAKAVVDTEFLVLRFGTNVVGMSDYCYVHLLMELLQRLAKEGKAADLRVSSREGTSVLVADGGEMVAVSNNEAKLNRLLFELDKLCPKYQELYSSRLSSLGQIDSKLLRFRRFAQSINTGFEVGNYLGQCEYERLILKGKS